MINHLIYTYVIMFHTDKICSSTLCGRTEYNSMNPRVGARMTRALLSMKLPISANIILHDRARGSAEAKYQK